MKKIMYVLVIFLCSISMACCEKEEIEPITYYEDKGDYKTEIPENLDFGMTIDEVKELYGESPYTIDPILLPNLDEKNKVLLYYKTQYLTNDCLLRLSFEDGVLKSIGYLLSETLSGESSNLVLRKNVYERFSSIYGNPSTLDNNPTYLAIWRKRLFNASLYVSDSSEVTEIEDNNPVYIFFSYVE